MLISHLFWFEPQASVHSTILPSPCPPHPRTPRLRPLGRGCPRPEPAPGAETRGGGGEADDMCVAVPLPRCMGRVCPPLPPLHRFQGPNSVKFSKSTAAARVLLLCTPHPTLHPWCIFTEHCLASLWIGYIPSLSGNWPVSMQMFYIRGSLILVPYRKSLGSECYPSL